MAGPANVRDLGGLPLAGGGHTRPGVLLRGEASYDGDRAPSDVPWPPTTVVDLRGTQEGEASPAAWPERTTVVRHPLFDAAALDDIPADSALATVYEGILTTASGRVAAVAGLLGSEGPTLIHCTAGKDRTGVVTAALLLVAGVEPVAVVADYRRTEQAMPDVLERAFGRGVLDRGRLHPAWAAAPTEAIAAVINRITGWRGGPRQWHLDHGADAAALDAFVARLTA